MLLIRHGRMAVARMLLPELSTIHEQFLALSRIAREQFSDSLAGKLLLRSQLDAEGTAAVVAASIAGAASLCVDADADRLREGLRAGFVDFVIGALDEALRILKNEIRRARAVSVGLTTAPGPGIDAMIERGLQPDLLSAIPQHQADVFLERGAASPPLPSSSEPGTSILEWLAVEEPARTMPRVAELASASLDPALADTPARLRWLAQSPRYLGRSFARQQCLRMTAGEIAVFTPQIHDAYSSVKITRDGEVL